MTVSGLGRADKNFKEKQKLFSEMGFSETSNVYLYDIGVGPSPFHPSMEQFARIYVSDMPAMVSFLFCIGIVERFRFDSSLLVSSVFS